MISKHYINLDAATFLQKIAPTKMAEARTIVLDVRTWGEFCAGHIDGAIHIDLKSTDFVEEVADLDAGKAYYVYCRIGVRSANACIFMKTQGFAELYNLQGGLSNLTAEQQQALVI